MVKKVKYTQLKAKENWLLHTTSHRKKLKGKSRVSCPKSLSRDTTAVSRLRVEPSKKRNFLSFFLDIGLISRLGNDTIEQKEVYDLSQARKWRIFRLNLVNIPGVKMASNAVRNGAHCVRYCVEKTCNSIDVFRDSLNEGVKNSFRGIEFCKEKLKQTTAFMFPCQTFKRKFDELNDRISDLEMEIKKIKTLSNSQVQCQNCQSGEGTCKTLVPNTTHIPLPPAPPLPPPPPPPPTFVLPLNKNQKINAIKSSSNTKEIEKSQVISLDDIKSIKLRKISDRKNSAKCRTPQEKPDLSRKPLREISNDDRTSMSAKKMDGKPLVTLKDLQAIKLKKKAVDKDEFTFKSPGNMLTLRSSLRKVNIKRSPGGTPLDRTVQDTGTGLTPIMTRALQKKFKLFTLSPLNSTPSPFSTISPLSIR
ncbi:proline-rich protein 11-like isoform X2 [Actinia tenebrosa]|uniref:Proline-rich protein 11-like isoform X2 n=1 Tax=Actinia tenebrosa TaxID=6105 RepID=A0A6P8HGE8_ACTTE|nr:proline-rich protein 11-like isoform X2 [Actinia tenebrosa]